MNFKLIVLGYPLYIIRRILNILLPHPLQMRNAKFKNIHKGETCFILGSGPSIKNQDLTKLSGQIVMTQNHFHSHKDIGIIKPKYHVITPKHQSEAYDKNWCEWLDSMEKRLPNETVLFAGTNTKYLVDQFEALKSRAYYVQHGLSPLYLNKAMVDITKDIMNVYTAINECLTIALYMGFEKIYLLGFDLNQVCIIQQDRDNVRFYGNSPITDNNAERQYEKELGNSGGDWFNMWMIWRHLNLLKNYAEKHNIQIINATQGGLLDIFPRENYDNIPLKRG